MSLFIAVCLFGLFAGAIDANAETRIIGGTAALPHQFPHQVSLRRRRDRQHICGGSIITNHWILTAAHCNIDKTPENMQVWSGAITPRDGDPHEISHIIDHPAYDRNERQNDIALLLLSTPIIFSRRALPIQLPQEDIPEGATNLPALVSGWGLTSVSFVTARAKPKHLAS